MRLRFAIGLCPGVFAWAQRLPVETFEHRKMPADLRLEAKIREGTCANPSGQARRTVPVPYRLPRIGFSKSFPEIP